MNKYTLVQFDADSTTFAGEYAIQERWDDGSFQGLYDLEGETLATRHSFPRASWSTIAELESEEFWNALNEAEEINQKVNS